MDEDITSLAAAATPSREPVGALRMPAEPGLMLFAQPIGNIDFSVSIAMTGPWSTAAPGLSDELRVDSPIVAVSWSRWSPADLEFVDAPSTTRWALKNHDGSTTPLPYNLQGVWLTFWTTGKKGWDALPPNQPIAVENQTGKILTAAHLAAREARANVARLVTIGELFLRLDRPLPLLGELDTRTEWAQMVYAAWQLMTETGTAQPIETETVSRGRHGRRRDQRAGIPGSGTVRLVRVGPASSTPSTCDPKAY
jgi:hypothetical protein